MRKSFFTDLKTANKMKLLIIFLITIFSQINAQHQNIPPAPIPLRRNPFPKPNIALKPARTIADTAQEFWIENECIYPPKVTMASFFWNNRFEIYFVRDAGVCTEMGIYGDN